LERKLAARLPDLMNRVTGNPPPGGPLNFLAGEAGMAELPQLPEAVEQKLRLLWLDLIEDHGFTQARLKLKPAVTKAAPPPRVLNDDDADLAFLRMVRQRVDRDPVLEQAVAIATKRFPQVMNEYQGLWSCRPGAKHETIAEWMSQIVSRVAMETESLWPDRDGNYKRASRAQIERELTPLVQQSIRAARRHERLRIEHPSLQALDGLIADAEAGRAVTVADLAQALGRHSSPNISIPDNPVRTGTTTGLADNAIGGAAVLKLEKRGGRKPGSPVNGPRLRELREHVPMTQEVLAEKCDLSPDTIQRGEADGRWGDSTFGVVAEILSALLEKKITPDHLKKPQKPQKPQ
jgi:hypothetical protein